VSERPAARVLFVHTGGTLAMSIERPRGPLLTSAYAEDVLPYVRGLEELAEISGHVLANLDSSDMEPRIWEQIATVVAENRTAFDGFVVLHGTDTMAYTACALSYVLQGLDRPVVLTGSQRPLREVRSDARLNLIHATLTATMALPEVTICFSHQVFRGNRAQKVSLQELDAFWSPNFPPLLDFGVEIVPAAAPLPAPTLPFAFAPGFDDRVAVLSLFPGARPGLLDALVAEGSRGIVLVGFGDANVATTTGWPEAIARATERDVAIVVATQAPKGAVKPGRYVGSEKAAAAGALFAGDMTLEAVVVKLMWALARSKGRSETGVLFERVLAGERTE
jgi:L-asparaginase